MLLRRAFALSVLCSFALFGCASAAPEPLAPPGTTIVITSPASPEARACEAEKDAVEASLCEAEARIAEAREQGDAVKLMCQTEKLQAMRELAAERARASARLSSAPRARDARHLATFVEVTEARVAWLGGELEACGGANGALLGPGGARRSCEPGTCPGTAPLPPYGE